MLLRISSLYPSLNEAERKVADAILRDADSVRALSITRLSEISKVSQTTVNRFCRAAGYDGYSDFKLALVEDLVRNRAADSDEAASRAAETGDLGGLVRGVFTAGLEAIQDTLNNLDMPEVKRAVDAIARARTVGAFGVGSSLPIAMDLHYRLLRSGYRAMFVSDSHMQAINAAMMTSEDVAVIISYSGETKDSLDIVDLALDAGATTIGVTSFPRSTLAQRASIALITSTKKTFSEDEAVTTRMAQLALLDSLCAAANRDRAVTAVGDVLHRIDKAVARKRKR